jgi:putative ABC transport system permease protein
VRSPTVSVSGSRPRYEEAPGRDGVVVLSEQLWRSSFGADPTIIGRTVELDGSPRTVVGVLPQAARFPPNAELWVPLALQPEERRYNDLDVIGRLAPGVSLDRARASLTAVGARAAEAAGLDRGGWGVRVQTLQDYQTGYRRTLLSILLGAAAFVLLIACANVANMLLARAAGRGRELAVRAALGAGRRRIARQLLTESALLALGGALTGTALAVGATSLLRRSIPAELASFVAGWDRMTVDGRPWSLLRC